MIWAISRSAVTGVVYLLAAGCSVLAPLPDRSRYFILTSLPAAEIQRDSAPGAETGTGLVIGLGPVTLPAYLDRYEVATRVSPTELSYSPTDRWAGPLAANVADVLQNNLSALLPSARVVPYPWVSTTPLRYEVEVDLIQFETDADRNAFLVARWTVTETRTGRRKRFKETALEQRAAPGDAFAATNGLSRTLGDLSRAIADELQVSE
jgi:uncharacterized protein